MFGLFTLLNFYNDVWIIDIVRLMYDVDIVCLDDYFLDMNCLLQYLCKLLKKISWLSKLHVTYRFI